MPREQVCQAAADSNRFATKAAAELYAAANLRCSILGRVPAQGKFNVEAYGTASSALHLLSAWDRAAHYEGLTETNCAGVL